ncbi:MAG: hypothetical protein H0V39_00230 [Nitrosomonas sp.]|nr:hypothetical protein [Nitrosomonas sp.]
MFRELSELEHVFEQLDNDCKLPAEEELNWICGDNSEFNIRLTALMQSVNKLELAHGLIPGKSYQSEILINLGNLLRFCYEPSRLAFSLPELKELLFKAYVISLDRRIDSLSQYSSSKRKGAENWKKFEESKRGTDDLTKLLQKILQELGVSASNKNVLKKLKDYAADENHKLVQEIDDEYVYWGKDKTTSLKSIDNRLSIIRQQI